MTKSTDGEAFLGAPECLFFSLLYVVGIRESHDWHQVGLLRNFKVNKRRHDTEQESANYNTHNNSENRSFKATTTTKTMKIINSGNIV